MRVIQWALLVVMASVSGGCGSRDISSLVEIRITPTPNQPKLVPGSFVGDKPSLPQAVLTPATGDEWPEGKAISKAIPVHTIKRVVVFSQEAKDLFIRMYNHGRVDKSSLDKHGILLIPHRVLLPVGYESYLETVDGYSYSYLANDDRPFLGNTMISVD
jgi:hypothetical protein